MDNYFKKLPVILSVPYYSQLDNVKDPHRTCNTSACCMVANYIKPGVFDSDDEYFLQLEKYGDTTEHDAHTKLLESVGIKSRFEHNLNYIDLDWSLAKEGLPIVIGVLHRGSLNSPLGGHMMVVIGKLDISRYVVHDPYGKPFSYEQDSSGFAQVVPKESLDRRWLVDGASSGWGRLFHP